LEGNIDRLLGRVTQSKGCWGYSIAKRSSGNSSNDSSESPQSAFVVNNLPER
jgi:hypothetical protein